MDFRERLEQSRKRPAELVEGFSCPYFSTQKGGAPACLELRLANGVRKAMPYSFLVELCFDIEKGIEILTSGKRITITGRNLTKLFEYLISYRVKYVQADCGFEDSENENDLFVAAIQIEPLD